MEDNDNSNSRDGFNDESRIVQKQLFWYDIRNFPDSLLIDILARLPVKSISMFKCVCKHWKTLISDRFFSRFYYSIRNPISNLNLNFNSNSNPAVLPFRILKRYAGVQNIEEFVNRLGPEIHSSSSESSLLFPSTPEIQRRCNQLKVLDISNGLILCCPTSLVYYICDPLTQIWITIPRPGPAFHERFWEGLLTRVNEHHMLTGYTVVRINPLKSRFFYLILEMFSSETGKWIEHRVTSYIPFRLRDLDGGPIHCYGALHWPGSHDNGSHAMLAFDPYKDPKSVRIIPFPEDRSHVGEGYGMRMWFQLCGESQGTLRYFEVCHYRIEFNFIAMWTMKDYEKGEWCCEFKVGFSDIHSGEDLDLSNWSVGRFCPLAFHPLNQNVVYMWCKETKRIMSYDVLSRRLDVASEPIIVDIWQSVSSADIIPFVLARWPALLFQLPLSFNSKIKGKKCRQ